MVDKINVLDRVTLGDSPYNYIRTLMGTKLCLNANNNGTFGSHEAMEGDIGLIEGLLCYELSPVGLKPSSTRIVVYSDTSFIAGSARMVADTWENVIDSRDLYSVPICLTNVNLDVLGFDLEIELNTAIEAMNATNWGVTLSGHNQVDKRAQRYEKELIDSWEEFLTSNWDKLVAEYQGYFVAIVDGEVKEKDRDLSKLAEKVYSKYGYRPIFMPHIVDKKETFEYMSPIYKGV